MMTLISSLESMPIQTIPFDMPLGPIAIAALAVVMVLAVADQARARLFPRTATRAGLRVVHSH